MENPNLSTSRRDPLSIDSVDGYAEGWGEYAADLGFEAGVYETDLEQYGRHATDVFMSARLVVDSGLNALGWTAERAREYLRQHTLLTEVEITTEVDRYGGDLPGQALCYKAGMLEFVRLRRVASDRQGINFDVARYHQYLINAGNLPFDLLAAHIDRFTENDTVM
jgi:uncharacterized protein (DUF885 family)